MSSLHSPTPSIIEENREAGHRIHDWISQTRSHSPVDAFSPPSPPATPDLTSYATTYNEPQWQHSATRTSNYSLNPADPYLGAKGARIPMNGRTNQQLPLTGNVAMHTNAPPVGHIPALTTSRGVAPMTLSSSTRRPIPALATLPGPTPIPYYIPHPIQLSPVSAVFPGPMPPPVIHIRRSRRPRSRSRSHHTSGRSTVVPESTFRTTMPRRSAMRNRSPSPVRLPRDYSPTSPGPSPRSARSRDRRSSRPRTRSPPSPRDRSRGMNSTARNQASSGSSPVTSSSSNSRSSAIRNMSSHKSHDVNSSHHPHQGTSRQRSSSQSYPHEQPASSRPTYGRQRSYSVGARDPRMSRSRPGGAYPAQAQGNQYNQGYASASGAGYGGSSQPQAHGASAYSSPQQTSGQMPFGANTSGNHYTGQPSSATPMMMNQPQLSAYSQSQPSANQMSMGAHTMGNYYHGQYPAAAPPSAMAQPHMHTTVLSPISDGRGGWTYTLQQGQNLHAMNPGTGQSMANPNDMTRGRQSSSGFFSRMFGLGGRSKSAAPEVVYPIHSGSRHGHAAKPVLHTHPRPRHVRRRSSR